MEDVCELKIGCMDIQGKLAIRNNDNNLKGLDMTPDDVKLTDFFQMQKNQHNDPSVDYLFSLVAQNNFKNLIACMYNHQNLSKFSRNRDGMTLLHLAAKKSSFAMFNKILELKLDINALDHVNLVI